MEIPTPCVVEKQRDVKAHRQPLLGTQEHDTEEPMDGVFRKHQLPQQVTNPLYIPQSLPRMEWVALIDGDLEVSLELIKGCDVPYCKEYEGDAEDQRQHVAEGSKCEHN